MTQLQTTAPPGTSNKSDFCHHFIGEEVARYLAESVQSLYSPAVYRDAGIPDAYEMRTELMADPKRHEADRKVVKRTMDFLTSNGILPQEVSLR